MDFVENNNEEEIEVKVLNRSVAILQLNENFYSFYQNSVEAPLAKGTVLEQVHTFLIPPLENDDEVEDYLVENFQVFFEALLEEFIDDEQLIENALTPENFDQWIEYNFSPFVMDAATDHELKHEDDLEDEETSFEGSALI